MIWQPARVDARDCDHLTLVFSDPDDCQQCARGQGCGAGVFSSLFRRSESRVKVPVRPGVAPGDWVHVGLEPAALVGAVMRHYGLPLVGFLAGAVSGHLLAGENPGRDLVALGGGLISAALLIGWRPGGRQPVLNLAIQRLSCHRADTNS